MENSSSNTVARIPDAIIEARFSLTAKQNNIIDMLFCELAEDDNLVYELSIDKYRKHINGNTTNIYRDLEKAVEKMEGKGVKFREKDLIKLMNDDNTNENVRVISSKRNKEKKTWFSWFTKIEYIPNYGKIIVKLDDEFKQILCAVKRQIKYDVKYTLNYKSAYSQRWYYYLKSFIDTGWRIDLVEDLIYKMECPETFTKNFAQFEKNALKKPFEEINNNSDIEWAYEKIKTGRKITHIKSYIKRKEENATETIKCSSLSVEYILNSIGGLIDGEFDANKIVKALADIGKENDITYYKEKVDAVIQYRNKNPESVFIALLLKAIKEDWKVNKPKAKLGSPINKGKQLRFADYNQRQYNDDFFKDLEEHFQDELHNHD